ncbi:MAG TPA: hypothetical protein VF458_19320 [Ktedonobacteraceae bacterium]
MSFFHEERDFSSGQRSVKQWSQRRPVRRRGQCRNCGRELLYNVDTECCAGCYGSFMRKIDHRIKHCRY